MPLTARERLPGRHHLGARSTDAKALSTRRLYLPMPWRRIAGADHASRATHTPISRILLSASPTRENLEHGSVVPSGLVCQLVPWWENCLVF